MAELGLDGGGGVEEEGLGKLAAAETGAKGELAALDGGVCGGEIGDGAEPAIGEIEASARGGGKLNDALANFARRHFEPP